MTETAAQVLCRDSRLSVLARAVLCGERLTSHDVRLRGCTCVHCTAYGAGAVYSSCLVSCPCVWGAARRYVGGRHLPPSPKGVTPAAARTILFLILPMRSCREGPEHFGPTPLPFFGLASSGRVTPFSRVTRLLSLQMVTRPPNRWSKACLV